MIRSLLNLTVLLCVAAVSFADDYSAARAALDGAAAKVAAQRDWPAAKVTLKAGCSCVVGDRCTCPEGGCRCVDCPCGACRRVKTLPVLPLQMAPVVTPAPVYQPPVYVPQPVRYQPQTYRPPMPAYRPAPTMPALSAGTFGGGGTCST